MYIVLSLNTLIVYASVDLGILVQVCISLQEGGKLRCKFSVTYGRIYHYLHEEGR